MIVQDPTLPHRAGVTDGLRDDGHLLVNSSRPAIELTGRPVPNAALLGGFAAVADVVSVDSVAFAIRNRFTGHVADGNVAAAHRAFE